MSKQLENIKEIIDCYCAVSSGSDQSVYGDCGNAYAAPNIITEGTFGCTVGLATITNAHLALLESFQDLQLKVNPIATTADTVVIEYQGPGVHTGEFMGLPASNKTAIFSGTAIYKFQDGKIVQQHNQLNIADLVQQLGWQQLPIALPNNAQQLQGKYQQLQKQLRCFYNNGRVLLTNREIEVLSFWVNGRSAKEIGNFFQLSYRTVQSYIANIMAKFNCNSKRSLLDVVSDHKMLHWFREFYDLCIMSRQ